MTDLLHGVRILVVDDDADQRDMLAVVLVHEGAVVRPAGSVEEAMHEVLREPPHVIVTDVRLNGETGFDLLRGLRALPADPAGGRVPVVALTGFGDDEGPRDPDHTFDARLRKPVDFDELLHILAGLLGGGRSGDATT
jgi:CheY-like chemotaxis protein